MFTATATNHQHLVGHFAVTQVEQKISLKGIIAERAALQDKGQRPICVWQLINANNNEVT
jgi:hypothetical protein